MSTCDRPLPIRAGGRVYTLVRSTAAQSPGKEARTTRANLVRKKTPPSADPSSTPSNLQGQLTTFFPCERLLIHSQPVAYTDLFLFLFFSCVGFTGKRMQDPARREQTIYPAERSTAHASHHHHSFTGCVMRAFSSLTFLALSRERPHACLPNVVPEAFEGRVDYCDFPFPMRSVMLCYERSGRASGGFEHDRPICTTVSPWVPSRHRLVRWSCQDVRALRARARVCGSRVCV